MSDRETRIAAYRQMIDLSHSTSKDMGYEFQVVNLKPSEEIRQAINGEPFDKEMALLCLELYEARFMMASIQAQFIESNLTKVN